MTSLMLNYHGYQGRKTKHGDHDYARNYGRVVEGLRHTV